ncbi:kinase-like domain-containing protein [Ephemerocybe angulata]|uniref:Kinase-like domain-containing protein n=1 Tax=Ephemerocybe angulata TaxID=980116 RepID=A0A8H6HQ93_9AGAR|nr:kinase-like domain-containing protein [Tulosesus angulatus]
MSAHPGLALDSKGLKDLLDLTLSSSIYPMEELISAENLSEWSAKDLKSNRDLVIKVKALGTTPKDYDISDATRVMYEFQRKSAAVGQDFFVEFIAYAVTDEVAICEFERYKIALCDILNQPVAQPFLGTQIRAIATQVLTGLDYLHRNGLVHGNLASSSVVLVDATVVSFTDFSAGRFVTRRVLRSPVIKITDYDEGLHLKKRTGRRVVGVCGYEAPEIVFGMKWSYPVDIFAFGCLITELYIGKVFMPSIPNDTQYLTRLERLLGRLSLPFVDRLAAKGFQRLFNEYGELIRDLSDCEPYDKATSASLAELLRRPDLVEFVRLALVPDSYVRVNADFLLTHQYLRL